jgi:ABC-2 type transport system permease protein/lipopolysaccharide transport system permease protein
VATTFAVQPESDDPISQWLLIKNELDELPIRLALDLLRPGDRVLDVGAHIGSYALPAAALGCEVVAVEASPTNARLLEEAAAANGFDNLRVIHAAAGDHDGESAFVPRGAHGFVPRIGDDEGLPDQISVPAVRLADLIREIGWDSVDVIKLDIEGSEPAAIKGLRELLLGEVKPLILVESDARMLGRSRATPRSLLNDLAACGYLLFAIDKRQPGRMVRVDPDDLQVDSAVDYLASASFPALQLPQWSVAERFQPAELIDRLVEAGADRDAESRAHAAATLTLAPDEIRDDPEMLTVRAALTFDLGPETRATAARLKVLVHRRRTQPTRIPLARSVRTGRPPRPWPVFKVLARRELLIRYHRSLLGMGWAVLTPLLTVGALWAVLSQVFRAREVGVPYVVYVLSGITMVGMTTQVVQQVGQCLVASETLRVKIRISPRVVALAGTTSVVVYTGVLLVALIALQIITGVGVPATAVLALPVLVLLLIASIGVGMVVASIAVRVKDTLNALAIVIILVNYLTPTFYPLSVVPSPWRTLVTHNPLTHYLNVLRAVAYGGTLGPERSWIVIGVTTVLSLLLGMRLFDRSARYSVAGR